MQLPWETLYHPEWGFLGRHPAFSLSRHTATSVQTFPIPKAEPLRVLLFSSLPDDLSERERLDIENEQAQVQEALFEAELRGEIQLHMPDDGRFESFKTELQTFKPHVVYLSGHGTFQVETALNKVTSGFLFEDALGNKSLMNEAEIAACFSNIPVQLVVLSACLSAKQDPRYPDRGLSYVLYQAGVPQVIGMRESVSDQAGVAFAKALLGEITAKERVDIALQAARQAIATSAAAPMHWCLPQLLSHVIHQPLTDWSFTPQPKTPIPTKELLGDISVPERFLGRRRELRKWQNRLLSTQHKLLITGAGGMGKTALASKLIAKLTHEGYHLFSISLRPEHDWQEIELAIKMALFENETLNKQYERLQTEPLSRAKLLEWLLKLSLKHFNNKLILFFDNLESVQSTTSPHAINDPEVQLWLDAALSVSASGLKVLATSRWLLPHWATEAHCALGRPIYGDVVAFAQQQALPLTGERLQKAYQVLGGNFRALEFFAKATTSMSVAKEEEFLAALSTASAEAQTDMALAKLLEHCTDEALQLLLALRAYPVAVPLNGVRKLGHLLKLADTPPLLDELLAVSLVEQYQSEKRGMEYQLAPIISSYLNQYYVSIHTLAGEFGRGYAPPKSVYFPKGRGFNQEKIDESVSPELLQAAAKFLYWQLEEKLNTTRTYAFATHGALSAAGLELEAHRLALEWIVGVLNTAGLYTTLLEQWLPPICESSDAKIKAEALGQTGKQYLHLGQYSSALDYLQRALSIRQDIGDKKGEGTTLNNISQIYQVRGDYSTALDYLQQSLSIQQDVGDKAGEGTTLNNISLIYRARGDYSTALDFLQRALSIRQDIGDKQGEGTTLNNISLIYRARGDYSTALDYLQQSLSITQDIGDKRGEGTTLNNISQIYQARGDYSTALDYLQRALSIIQDIGDLAGICPTLFNMASIYWQQEQQDTALQTWVSVYQIASSINLAEALKALENLAKQLGSNEGLALWERLAQQMEEPPSP